MKAQASLHIRASSPQPLLLAQIRHPAQLDGCAWVIKESVYGGRKVPLSHELVQIIKHIHTIFVEICPVFKGKILEIPGFHLDILAQLQSGVRVTDV